MFISPYTQVSGLVWFARMTEKIRLHARGGLPEDYLPYLGRAFDLTVFNEYMIKRGWRDGDAPASDLQEYKEQYGLGQRADVMTYFDFYGVDEGRMP